uniref:CCHC-type domain-containing protein n=1 Tax=Nicotiana tabacum TaxID=4097 RepID=A0A1S4D2W1_TOBAC|nr:PREDICTED: uncharacterized protein LOC107825414 [Nicotiana tabacum]
MADDEHRRLDRFGRLRPPSFSGAKSEDGEGFLDKQIEVVRSQEHGDREAKRPRGLGSSGGVPSGMQSYHSRGHPYKHAQTGHPNLPPFFERDCYECGELGHVRKYCPHFLRGPVQQRS